MKENNTKPLIEIRDPNIDADPIMHNIQQRIEKRRHEMGYEPQNFISFGGAGYPGKPDDIPYDPDLYHYLDQVNQTFIQVNTEIDLQPSPATRVPVLGKLWKMIRANAHQLSIFYANRAIQHQTNVNRELISVLNRLTVITQEQQREILKLQAQIDGLQK